MIEEWWVTHYWYRGFFWSSGLLMTVGFRYRNEGFENIPKTGPVLLLANHQSYLDTFPVGLAVRRHPVFLTRSTLFHNPFMRALIRSLGGVPIDQEGFARDGLRTASTHLKAGRAVLVFPEGERTSNGKILPFKPGIHLLIKRLDVPIVPIGLAGAYEAWPRTQLLPRFSPVMWPRALFS